MINLDEDNKSGDGNREWYEFFVYFDEDIRFQIQNFVKSEWNKQLQNYFRVLCFELFTCYL